MIALQKSSRIWTICRLFPHNHCPASQAEAAVTGLAPTSATASASATSRSSAPSAHSHVATAPPSRTFSQTVPRVMRALNDPENMGNMQKGVNFDTLGSWNKRLDLPIMFEQSVQYGKPVPKIPLEEIGIASLMGRRKTNEDRYVVKELSPDLLLAGIFDGHGGSLAAEFLSEHLEDHILYWLRRSEDLEFVLEQAFIDINNMLGRHIAFYHLYGEESNSGTTATVMLLRNSLELAVAHVGDSRAILRRTDSAQRLSFDDHPEVTSEADRVRSCRGQISTNSLGEPLVNGRLAMTRSIGDMMLKPFGVTARPHIQTVRVKHGKDAFLILVTDGIVFALSDQEIVNIVSGYESPQTAAEFLSDQALQFGSQDNATAIIIPFGAWGKYHQMETSVQHSFGRTLIGGSTYRS